MNNEEFRRALLERAPDPGAAEAYRRKVETMMQDMERRVRLGAWANGVGYVTALLTAIALMIIAGVWYDGQLKQVWLGVNACFWLVFALAVIFNQLMNSTHVKTLKELKGIEMRIIEIQQRMEQR
jgi:Na+/melibiose symporter-like transporter